MLFILPEQIVLGSKEILEIILPTEHTESVCPMSYGNRGVPLFHLGKSGDTHPDPGGKGFLSLVFLKSLGLETCSKI
jgi:hypothetical protein